MEHPRANRVDRYRRDRLAELLRHFAAGRITNDDWEDQALKLIHRATDRVLDATWGIMWFTYDDFHEHRLAGKHALSAEWRQLVTRTILFLYSDLPYEWPRPRPSTLFEIYLKLFTLGLVDRNPEPPHPATRPEGKDLWPFFRQKDLKCLAESRPRLLAGIQ